MPRPNLSDKLHKQINIPNKNNRVVIYSSAGVAVEGMVLMHVLSMTNNGFTRNKEKRRMRRDDEGDEKSKHY